MTREAQIRQTANVWLGYYHPTCTQDMLVEAFRCGAQWADAHNPEIAYLKHEIEGLKSKLQAADDLNTLLAAELEKAKSPWVRVVDRLPEEDPDDKGYSVEVIGLFPNGQVSKCYCSIEEGIWFIKALTCDRPTHWMPIPELQTTK